MPMNVMMATKGQVTAVVMTVVQSVAGNAQEVLQELKMFALRSAVTGDISIMSTVMTEIMLMEMDAAVNALKRQA
jgi:hypothetical protein